MSTIDRLAFLTKNVIDAIRDAHAADKALLHAIAALEAARNLNDRAAFDAANAALMAAEHEARCAWEEAKACAEEADAFARLS